MGLRIVYSSSSKSTLSRNMNRPKPNHNKTRREHVAFIPCTRVALAQLATPNKCIQIPRTAPTSRRCRSALHAVFSQNGKNNPFQSRPQPTRRAAACRATAARHPSFRFRGRLLVLTLASTLTSQNTRSLATASSPNQPDARTTARTLAHALALASPPARAAMSGGVGPTAGGGITLPSSGAPMPPLHPTPTSPTARPHHHYYLFSIKQLNTLGAAAVLAFSTTVPLSEIAFALLVLPYLLVLAAVAFPQRPGKPDPAAPVFPGLAGRLRLAIHTALGFAVGAALPALYILDGLRTGDTAGVAHAAPHAFLFSAQVFTEGFTSAFPGKFSLPVRAAVAVMYGVRRMFSASEWLRQEMEARDELGRGPPVAPRRIMAGRALAAANMVFWGLDLFLYVLPFYLPKALRRYYLGRDHEDDDGKDRSRTREQQQKQLQEQKRGEEGKKDS
ncbi:hypothetical protein EJB05_51562, partial [Eragrostis curvula]